MIPPFPLGALAKAALAELDAAPEPAAECGVGARRFGRRKGPAMIADPQRMRLHAVVLATGEQIDLS